MALFFTSGGGRLGNQILNLIHLIALKQEHNIEVIKINDVFLKARKGFLMYKVSEEIINWKIYYESSQNNLFYKLFLKVFIRFFHLFFYLSPSKKSYKIGLKNNYPRLILGDNLGIDFSVDKLIQESKKQNIALSGWGLRDWKLVLKHRQKIVNILKDGFCDYINFKVFDDEKYLLIHIRREDFLEVEDFKDLNFTDEVWLKGILKLCQMKNIEKVVIFSDSKISEFLFLSLKIKGLKIIIPEIENNNENFLKLFFTYVYNSSSILCNASSLVLSISFLSHEYIYLPSQKNDLQKIPLNDAHKLSPTFLNWS